MNMNELAERIRKGECLMLVEYRSSEVERIKFRDKETGKAEEMVKLSHTVEAGTSSFKVSERTNGDFRPDEYRPAFKKGQAVVLVVDSYGRDKSYNRVASGRLEKFEA